MAVCGVVPVAAVVSVFPSIVRTPALQREHYYCCGMFEAEIGPEEPYKTGLLCMIACFGGILATPA